MSASASPSAALHASTNFSSATRNARSSAIESMRAVSPTRISPLLHVFLDQVRLLRQKRHVRRRRLQEPSQRLDGLLEALGELFLLLVAPGVFEVAHPRVQAGDQALEFVVEA